MNAEPKFELFAVVELFGHLKISGKCTEQNIAGTNMLRVDVPQTSTQAAFTRFFGAGAIYSINPVDEETAKLMAERLEVKPIDSWNLSEIMKKAHEKMLLKESSEPDHDPDVNGEVDELEF